MTHAVVVRLGPGVSLAHVGGHVWRLDKLSRHIVWGCPWYAGSVHVGHHGGICRGDGARVDSHQGEARHGVTAAHTPVNAGRGCLPARFQLVQPRNRVLVYDTLGVI